MGGNKERDPLQEALFGSDDDEDIEEESPAKDDRKSKLQDLAARKAAERRQEEAAKGGRYNQNDEEQNDEDDGIRSSARPIYDSEDDQEGPRTVADDLFIDDDGVEEDVAAQLASDSDGEEPGGTVGAEEAIEDDGLDEFEKLQQAAKAGRKRKRADEDTEKIKAEVELFLSRMELAVEKDVKANEEKKPAIHKLKLCREMVDTLSQSHLQGTFLDEGGLTVLTHWLSPLPDGSLPNINIRTAILKLLLQMPIHVELDYRRMQLKQSGLGKVVMFLYKLPEETTNNRRMAKELVERWSRPIFALENKHQQTGGEERVRRSVDDVRKRKGKKSQVAEQEELDEDGNPVSKKGPAPGERGWRWHASVPQASKLDYAVRPEPKFGKDDIHHKGGDKAKHDKLDKKLKNMRALNKRRVGADRPAKISVEGRGMLQ